MGLLERILEEFDQIAQPIDRPIVTLTYAQSLDGSITTRRGRPLQISGEESAILTHQLRANHDCILVGIGTVLADDPQLTVRLVDGQDPQPVILDSSLRTPVKSTLVRKRAPWIATTERADPQQAELLSTMGVKVLHFPQEQDKRVNLESLLVGLHQLGTRRLMVEGGAEVIASFLTNHLVDFLILTVSPMLVGGLPGYQMSNDTSSDAEPVDFPRLRNVIDERIGDDMIIFGRLNFPKRIGD